MTKSEILTALSQTKNDNFAENYPAIDALLAAQNRLLLLRALQIAFALGRLASAKQAEKSATSALWLIGKLIEDYEDN